MLSYLPKTQLYFSLFTTLINKSYYLNLKINWTGMLKATHKLLIGFIFFSGLFPVLQFAGFELQDTDDIIDEQKVLNTIFPTLSINLIPF